MKIFLYFSLAPAFKRVCLLFTFSSLVCNSIFVVFRFRWGRIRGSSPARCCSCIFVAIFPLLLLRFSFLSPRFPPCSHHTIPFQCPLILFLPKIHCCGCCGCWGCWDGTNLLHSSLLLYVLMSPFLIPPSLQYLLTWSLPFAHAPVSCFCEHFVVSSFLYWG